MSIKIEHVVLPSAAQMEFVIEGMRNPMNSWAKSDSHRCEDGDCDNCDGFVTCQLHEYPGWFKSFWDGGAWEGGDDLVPGPKDHDLMERLAKAGTEHRKYLRQMPVMVRITAPLYWWKEFDTYKVGTVANSCSTMHKIAEKEFSLEDFSCENLIGFGQKRCEGKEVPYIQGAPDSLYSPFGIMDMTVTMLNELRLLYISPEYKEFDKKMIWENMIQLLPSSYNQTRNVSLNYEVLANIHHQRKNHKLKEWNDFCNWIETLPYADLIVRK